MISSSNIPFAQYAVGYEGLRRYKVVEVQETVAAGTWPASDLYINVPVYDSSDISTSRFRDYIFNIYGNYSGGPNDSTKWYDAKDYAKSAFYQETSGGAIKNFLINIEQAYVEPPFTPFSGIGIFIQNTGAATLADAITFKFKVHIMYSPVTQQEWDWQ